MSQSAASPQPPVRPVSVWIIYLVLFLQGSVIILGTVAEVVLSDAEVLDTAGVIAMLVLFVLTGAVLILLGFRILWGAAGARTPVMVLQLLMVVISFSFFAGSQPLVGLAVLVPAAAALVLLFIHPTQQWLGGGRGSQPA